MKFSNSKNLYPMKVMVLLTHVVGEDYSLKESSSLSVWNVDVPFLYAFLLKNHCSAINKCDIIPRMNKIKELLTIMLRLMLKVKQKSKRASR